MVKAVRLSLVGACVLPFVAPQYFMQPSWDGISAGPNGQLVAQFFYGTSQPPADPNPITYYKKGNDLVMRGDIDVYIMYYTKFIPATNGGDGWGNTFPNIKGTLLSHLSIIYIWLHGDRSLQ